MFFCYPVIMNPCRRGWMSVGKGEYSQLLTYAEKLFSLVLLFCSPKPDHLPPKPQVLGTTAGSVHSHQCRCLHRDGQNSKAPSAPLSYHSQGTVPCLPDLDPVFLLAGTSQEKHKCGRFCLGNKEEQGTLTHPASHNNGFLQI